MKNNGKVLIVDLDRLWDNADPETRKVGEKRHPLQPEIILRFRSQKFEDMSAAAKRANV